MQERPLQLQQFLEDYSPSLDKQAFLDVYHMLSLLGKYLYDNLRQHTHCMLSDNEYVILLKYAIRLNIDLSVFPTLWAVLSILLYTQDSKCEYVQVLQEEYNTYYAGKSRKYMQNLERKSVEIQNRMHHSITQNFDRVSDSNDNGLTPLQGQQNKHPEAVNIPGNAIDDDVVPHGHWTQMTVMILIKLLMTEVKKKYKTNYIDTPVKTEINKPYIDNTDAYNRDKL